MARIYLPSLNPVALREMRSRVRGPRTLALFFGYLGVLALFIFVVYLRKGATTSYSYGGTILSGNYGPTRNFETGQDIFISVFLYLILMVAVVTPALCGGLFSREMEEGTYDLLLVTPVRGRTLVYGKLIAAVSYIFMLVLATLPLACIVFIFGGVGPEDLIAGYAIVLLEVVVFSIISLFFSALFRSTNVAVILTYFVIAFLLLGVPIASSSLVASLNGDTGRLAGTGFRVDPRTDPDFDLPKRLLVFNPFAALGSVLAPNAPYRTGNGEDLQLFPNSRLYWGNPTVYYGTPTFLPNSTARQRHEDAKLPILPYGLSLWHGYLLVYTAIGLVFLILSMGAVKPVPGGLIHYPLRAFNLLRKVSLPTVSQKGRRKRAPAKPEVTPAAPDASPGIAPARSEDPLNIAAIIAVAEEVPAAEAKKSPAVTTTGEVSPVIAPAEPATPPKQREALG